MSFFKWLAGFILLSLIIGLIFKAGGNLINLLLLIAALIFIIDFNFNRWKTTR
ncbi:hypothetical protein [Clostridium fermenticellae]|uniref:hypothetical protein n=1 Tax=Clostridium fermenticellae TaxID=2068654 RepID=UPI0013C4EB11|nr:hypothetical protein [Clostridium fermenticellae]